MLSQFWTFINYVTVILASSQQQFFRVAVVHQQSHWCECEKQLDWGKETTAFSYVSGIVEEYYTDTYSRDKISVSVKASHEFNQIPTAVLLRKNTWEFDHCQQQWSQATLIYLFIHSYFK